MRRDHSSAFARSAVAAIITGALISDACSNSEAPRSDTPSTRKDTTIVSAAVVSNAQNPPLILGARGEVVYVSLKTGSFPNGRVAVLRNLKRDASVTGLIVDGGLDPLAIEAYVGDTLAIRIESDMGLEQSGTGVVPPLLRPTVIRTVPPRGKTDVPLNTQIVVVFSEPIQPATANGIQLWRGGVAVPATVTVSSDGLRWFVQPNDPLAPGTTYTVVVPAAVTDLNGQTLGETVQVDFTTEVTTAITPVTPFGNVASVQAGVSMTCALTTAGDAYCWGANIDGRLGDGTTTSRFVPSAVPSGYKFTQISAGSHGCALNIHEGGVWCWGYNLFGEIGDETHYPRLRPTGIAQGLGFIEVSAGPGEHTCGVTSDHDMWCWGSNEFGQLGDGTREYRTGLRLVPSEARFTTRTISAGDRRTCAVKIDGVAYCWGDNSRGQLGDGTTVDRYSVTAVVGGLQFASISPGSPTHTCGLTTSSAAYCWGSNAYGKLGDGTTADRLVPVAVSGGLTFSALSVGLGNQTCGLTSSGAAYCWGVNDYGQLGDGTTISRSTPTRVAGGLVFVQLSAGDGHTCGVTVDGVAYCWGKNSNGQLGDGSATPRLVPTPVASPH